MGAAADVCMGESRRGMFAKVRARNPFLSNSMKKDADDDSSPPSSSPAAAKSPGTAKTEETMSETTVLLFLDRFAPS